MSNKGLMTPEEFELARPKLKSLKGTMVDLAEQVLVFGKTKTEAAKAVGVSRQNVQKHMSRISALINELPEDYVYFQEWIPETMAKEIRKKLKSIELERNK